MDGQRLAELLAARAGDEPVSLEHLCRLCAQILPASGAGIVLMTADGETANLCGSDEVSESLGHLQVTVGDGPIGDAVALGGPVLEPDLADATSRWPEFAGAAVAARIRAVFAFPLHVGAARLGVLAFYRAQPGELGEDELAEALVLADEATHLLLALQSGAPSESLAWHVQEVADHQAKVHQATGMVAVQLEATVSVAMARLRAHAWADGRTVRDVADDVVSRRLRFGETA